MGPPTVPFQLGNTQAAHGALSLQHEPPTPCPTLYEGRASLTSEDHSQVRVAHFNALLLQPDSIHLQALLLRVQLLPLHSDLAGVQVMHHLLRHQGLLDCRSHGDCEDGPVRLSPQRLACFGTSLPSPLRTRKGSTGCKNWGLKSVGLNGERASRMVWMPSSCG